MMDTTTRQAGASSDTPRFDADVVVPVRATTLSPYLYGGVAIQGGVSTIPTIVSDRALAFAASVVLGFASTRLCVPTQDYRSDISAMPWRTSLLVAEEASLLPPLARRSGLGEEGGYQPRFQSAAGSGNFKEYFFVQEAAAGAVYRGAFFGFDPFAYAGQDHLILRIGNGRSGVLRIERNPSPGEVRLNAATGTLFGRRMPVDRYLIHDIQMSKALSLAAAQAEVAHWNTVTPDRKAA